MTATRQIELFQAVTIAAVEAACAAHGSAHHTVAGPYIAGDDTEAVEHVGDDDTEAVEHVGDGLAVTWLLLRVLSKAVRHT